MLDTNPGQHQKAGVIGNQVQPAVPAAGVPTNQIIAAFDLKGRTGPSQTGDHLAVEINQVL